MKVLSLFDGMSCGMEALKRTKIKVDAYYASEIDKYAIKISGKNHPEIVQLGDVVQWETWDWDEISPDLLLAGSPCQGFSHAGMGLAFDDPRSALYFEFEKILFEKKPKYFLLENVRMKKEWEEIITERLGVEPILINSSLVSAQNRERLYWTNIPGITQPADKEIYLKDVVLTDVFPVALHNLYGGFKEKSVRVFTGKSPTLRTPAGGGHIPSLVKRSVVTSQYRKILMGDVKEKAYALNASDWRGLNRRQGQNAVIEGIFDENLTDQEIAEAFKGVSYDTFKDWGIIRKFDPIECERLQTLPDNFTAGVSNTQRYKMIGNGWTVDVIAHILRSLDEETT